MSTSSGKYSLLKRYLAAGALALCTRSADAQIALSRAEAIERAGANSPRAAVALSDSLEAAALVRVARQFENPTVSASYSKSEPQAHFALDIPFDWPSARAPRIKSAERTLGAATLRLQYNRALLALDADTIYTRGQANLARATLSARTARDADSVLVMARIRRDAGDASDLDVELAAVFDGQSANAAVADSIAAQEVLVALQTLIGLRPDSVVIALSEQIEGINDGSPTGVTRPRPDIATTPIAQALSNSMLVTAAERDADAALSRVLVEQRRRFASPSLSVGFESVGPSSGGMLPTLGLAVPLPLFNRNSANVQLAQTQVARARAAVTLARLEQSAAVTNARRAVSSTQVRLNRSQQLVAGANRIAALSLVAYREGAAPLAAVLDAQRSARETLAQFVDDVAAARIAESVLRFLSFPGGESR